jgi:hypothetical protein
MAFFSFSRSVATGATDTPLEVTGNTWKYQRVPYDCMVEVIHRATVTGVLVTINSGSDEVQQESPISSGGTAGVLTGRLNVEPITFSAKAGDTITLRYRNTNAGTANIDGTIELTRKG